MFISCSWKKNCLQGSPLPCSDSVIWCHLHVNICFCLQCTRGGIAEKLYDHQTHWSELVTWTYLLQRGEGKRNVSREGRRTRTISEVTSTTPPWLLLRISAEISQWEISLFLLLQYWLEGSVESLFNRSGERDWVSMGSADWKNCSSQCYSHCIRRSLWDPDLLVWHPFAWGEKSYYVSHAQPTRKYLGTWGSSTGARGRVLEGGLAGPIFVFSPLPANPINKLLFEVHVWY